MRRLRAFVSNIQTYSIHDGPGIRTVVFLMGCPLRCRWCANPENLEAKTTVGFLRKLCAGCGICAKTCPKAAILAGERRIDRAVCDGCAACTETCPNGALVRYGRELSVEEVFRKAARDRMFFEESGGGITVSGGEPLLHAEFVHDLFAMARGAGISTCIETCGCVPESAFRAVLPLTDVFLYDLKLADAEKHRLWTGQGNEQILANARFLSEAGAEVQFRQPLIPGVNDDADSIGQAADFLRSLGRRHELQLMPYHRMGLSKYQALDRAYILSGLEALSPETAETAAERYRALGIPCTVSK